MIILLISVYAPIKDYYLYIPYGFDHRYACWQTNPCGQRLMMEWEGVYSDFPNSYWFMVMKSDNERYCSVIDCAM